MKNSLFILVLLSFGAVFSQSNTEVYLFDIVKTQGKLKLVNRKNISNSNGYDNQPSFYDNDNILFSATRNGQTDVAKYNISKKTTTWLTDTPEGSEYSPLRIPNSNDISAVRLDTTGLQRLYRYNENAKDSKLLIKDLKVGYHIWDSDEQLITSVLVKEGMNLMLNYLPENKHNTISKSVGRSLHKIPNSDLMSFITVKNDLGTISSYSISTGKVSKITNMPPKTQDMCWLDKNTILIPKGKSLFLAYANNSESLDEIYKFGEKDIYNISRVAMSPNGKQLVLVSEVSPEVIVNEQVKTFNSGNLKGFTSCFIENVEVLNYPNEKLFVGHKELEATYSKDLKKNNTIKIVNRINIDDIIIDERIVTKNKKQVRQVAIHQVDGGYIKNMTLIEDKDKARGALQLFKDHNEYYNARSLFGFLTLYSNDVEVYNFPSKAVSKGKENFQKKYAKIFEKATDLEYKISNQIVIGNKVINDETVKIGRSSFRRIAIYELESGLIKKVTFIR